MISEKREFSVARGCGHNLGLGPLSTEKVFVKYFERTRDEHGNLFGSEERVRGGYWRLEPEAGPQLRHWYRDWQRAMS